MCYVQIFLKEFKKNACVINREIILKYDIIGWQFILRLIAGFCAYVHIKIR